MTAIQPDLKKRKRFERLTDSQLLTIISGVIFVLMCVIAVLTIEEFKKPGMMFLTILNSNSYLIILACALTVVMVGGGINISVGGVVCLTCMACSMFLNSSGIEDGPLLIWATFALAIGIGAAVGAFQGAMISYLEIQPFIITLAGMFLTRGLATILSGGGNVKGESEAFTKWMDDLVIKIPELGTQKIKRGKVYINPAILNWVSIVAIVVVIIIYLVMRYSKFGRNIYAIGGNAQSSKMLGINVKLTRFNSYLLSGALSGLAGFVFMMLNGAKGSSGTGLRTEMDAIAASIIGGTLLSGGVGNVIGSLFGTLILGTLQTIIGFSGLKEAYWQQMASGVMLGVFIVLQSIVLAIRSNGKIQLPAWMTVPGTIDDAETGQYKKAARWLYKVGILFFFAEGLILLIIGLISPLTNNPGLLSSIGFWMILGAGACWLCSLGLFKLGEKNGEGAASAKQTTKTDSDSKQLKS